MVVDCAVCLDGEGATETAADVVCLRVCRHAYHSECVGAWFAHRDRTGHPRTCPKCAAVVAPPPPPPPPLKRAAVFGWAHQVGDVFVAQARVNHMGDLLAGIMAGMEELLMDQRMQFFDLAERGAARARERQPRLGGSVDGRCRSDRG